MRLSVSNLASANTSLNVRPVYILQYLLFFFTVFVVFDLMAYLRIVGFYSARGRLSYKLNVSDNRNEFLVLVVLICMHADEMIFYLLEQQRLVV